MPVSNLAILVEQKCPYVLSLRPCMALWLPIHSISTWGSGVKLLLWSRHISTLDPWDKGSAWVVRKLNTEESEDWRAKSVKLKLLRILNAGGCLHGELERIKFVSSISSVCPIDCEAVPFGALRLKSDNARRGHDLYDGKISPWSFKDEGAVVLPVGAVVLLFFELCGRTGVGEKATVQATIPSTSPGPPPQIQLDHTNASISFSLPDNSEVFISSQKAMTRYEENIPNETIVWPMVLYQ